MKKYSNTLFSKISLISSFFLIHLLDRTITHNKVRIIIQIIQIIFISGALFFHETGDLITVNGEWNSTRK